MVDQGAHYSVSRFTSKFGLRHGLVHISAVRYVDKFQVGSAELLDFKSDQLDCRVKIIYQNIIETINGSMFLFFIRIKKAS